ncbi:MAG: late secretory pathway protein avl9 [Thelocarpon impressellum]|nr:MAG: late secretory pathway protein avl9 [Thelocarpon impressellum]
MSALSGFTPLVTVVGFHHARGPEVESWFGVDDGCDPAADNEWPLLPFMALSDGAHASTEDFSYFTLRHEATATKPATSLFGISCTRQLDASRLIDRPTDVTRSTVQKAVVVIADSPQAFGQVREKLSMVTKAWFAQRNFADVEILKKFQESLVVTLQDQDDDKDQYLGLSLRELIHEFKYQTLVLFKCCLLQPKMLFFGSRCERLCMMQFSLISLIPGLIRNLQDCADPELDNYRQTLVRPTSLKTSERNSLLSYMGLPLQIFGKGSLFGPYTPLQQLDVLADQKTRSYVVGSTNSLLLQQRDRYSDILINLDDESIQITSTSLRAVLALSVPDRRWIDFVTQSVLDTWDESNPGRPKSMGYVGSEEFIRLQFEEYLLSLMASVKYHVYLQDRTSDPRTLLADIEGDPSVDFGSEWVQAWMQTENYSIFHKFTDSHLFDIIEPRHPCAGGLTMEDVQRRVAQQVAELHLDERFTTGKEVLGKHLAEGQKKVSSALNNLWADFEVMREAQRRRHEERQAAADAGVALPEKGGKVLNTPDLTTAQASVTAASKSAGAYLSSWANWAGEKRRGGWARSPATSPTPTPAPTPVPSEKKSKLKRRSGQFSAGEGEGGLMPLRMGKRSFEEEVFSLEDVAPKSGGLKTAPESEDALDGTSQGKAEEKVDHDAEVLETGRGPVVVKVDDGKAAADDEDDAERATTAETAAGEDSVTETPAKEENGAPA